MPRCDLSIERHDGSRPVHPGGALEGHVEVFTDGGVQCDALELVWGWEADGKFVSTRETVERMTLFSGGELPGPGARRYPFRVEVPEDGPFSHEGRYLEIAWSLRARAEIPWAFDPRAEEEVRVAIPPASAGEARPEEVTFDDPERLPDQVPGLAAPILGGVIGFLLLVGGAVAAVFGVVEEEVAVGAIGGGGVLLGLLVLFRVVRPALAGRRIGPTRVTVTPETLRPGRRFVARVEMIPPKDLRIRGITAVLRGYEKVRRKPRRPFSDSSSTRRLPRYHTFHEEEVELAGPQTLPGGRAFRAGALLPVPPDASPSFFSAYNSILWTVDVRVRIPWWPDLEREFEVRVGL